MSRFSNLWQRNTHDVGQITNSSQSMIVYESLCAKYGESHRVYHDLDHIEHCLDLFDSAYDDIICHDAVELAIWFHDVIYEVGSHKNELNSALYFKEVSKGYLDDQLRQDVYELILLTTHKAPPRTQDGKVLVDIDLSSFAGSRDEFEQDGDKLRKEQEHLSDQVFFNKQIVFLEILLNRKRFFYSDFFFTRFEDKARANIKHQINYLKSIWVKNNTQYVV